MGYIKIFLGVNKKNFEIFRQVHMYRIFIDDVMTSTLLKVHFSFFWFKPFPGLYTGKVYHSHFSGPYTATARARVLKHTSLCARLSHAALARVVIATCNAAFGNTASARTRYMARALPHR